MYKWDHSIVYTIHYILHQVILYVLLLKLINPVQLPLHEPYFDLTLIRATHTKISNKRKNLFIFLTYYWKSKLIAHAPFSMWRVVSTNPRVYSPWHDDSRLLAISYSNSRVSGYYPYLFYPILEISLNSHFCIFLFRNMLHVYSPQYSGHDDLS